MDNQFQDVAITINGRVVKAHIEPRMLLIQFIREKAGLTGSHVGCDTSYCGACTVLLDGRSVKSCNLFAVQADGCEVTTVEGLENDGSLHVLQRSFSEHHALQCGYCTPGMLMSSAYHIQREENVSEETVRKALAGNVCRCTGYQNIIDAVVAAAAQSKEGDLG